MVGVDKKTVLRLLADVGDACAAYHDATIRDLTCVRVQCDEIWSFCHAKERNLKPHLRGLDDYGDLWTWIGMDADTKLIVSWRLGKRTFGDARRFTRDLASRIKSYVQITTDGLGIYKDNIRRAFKHRVDYGTEVKVYGLDSASSLPEFSDWMSQLSVGLSTVSSPKSGKIGWPGRPKRSLPFTSIIGWPVSAA